MLYFIGVLVATIPYSYMMNISGDIMIDIFQYRRKIKSYIEKLISHSPTHICIY